MLAQNDEYISEASETIYQLTQEERIRLQCQAREDYIRRQRSNEARTKQLVATIEEKDANIAELKVTIADLKTTIEEKDITIAGLKSTIEQQGVDIAELKNAVIALTNQLSANEVPEHIPE